MQYCIKAGEFMSTPNPLSALNTDDVSTRKIASESHQNVRPILHQNLSTPGEGRLAMVTTTR